MATFAVSGTYGKLRNYFCKYTLFAALMCTLTANAQNTRADSIYDPLSEPDTLYAIVNAVKFDPVQVFFGDFQFYFEKMIAPKASIEVGFGPTRRNYASSWFEDELDSYGRNVSIRTRYAATLSGRRYFQDTGELYGGYVGLSLVYREYVKLYQVIDTNDVLVAGYEFTDSRKYASAMVTVGFQALSLSSNIFADFYVAAGARYKSLHIVDTDNVNVPESYFIREETGFEAAFQAGVRIGFGF